jgi:arsenical pump membrane protein
MPRRLLGASSVGGPEKHHSTRSSVIVEAVVFFGRHEYSRNVTDGTALTLALLILGATLAVAVVRPAHVPEALVASAGAVLLIGAGAISWSAAGDALRSLGPTVGFLAAMLVIADGCRREGLFDAMGTIMARGSSGSPQRMLAFVFAVAAGITAVLSLDATIVLLTPVVFATAARMRTSAKPQVYACAHLANSASLLLPVSNLTNLLAFHATQLSFMRFAALMALPTLAAVAVEWIVFKRFFALELRRPRRVDPPPAWPRIPRFAVSVLALTLGGFALSSVVGIQPVWFAAAGAIAITLPALGRKTATPLGIFASSEPGFLIFVLALGVIVQAASVNGLDSAVRDVLPTGGSLPDLLAIAGLSAIFANLVNNLPATLMLVPVAAAAAGVGPVLAVLIGVNIGPNLTYVGSLATLLWRRVLRAEDSDVQLGEFLRLGAATVPATLLASTVLLWLALKV